MAKNNCFIHLCYNGNKFWCVDRYQVTKDQYVRWDDMFELDCFDEVNDTKGSHLFLDIGDCDDPVEITYLHDIR